MKKLIALITGFYIFATPPSSALVISEAVMGAVAGLMPILKPLAEVAIIDTAQHIQGLITGTSNSVVCSGSLFCGSKKLTSAIKEHCQKIEQVDAYELRIRFGTTKSGRKWNLAKCVRKAVRKGHQSPEGKGLDKSIAIYSQDSLDQFLSLIAFQRAARQVVNTKGAGLNEAELAKAGKTREKVIEEAVRLIKTIDDSIARNVAENVYYYQ